MDHSQASEDDLCVVHRDGRDSVLEHALRTYEESERSLKSICQAVEEENRQLENEWTILDDQQARLRKEHQRLKELVYDLRHERNRLDERQRLVDQQTNEFHQRFLFISLLSTSSESQPRSLLVPNKFNRHSKPFSLWRCPTTTSSPRSPSRCYAAN